MPTERASYAPGVTVNRVTDLSSLPEKDRANADRMAAKAKSLGTEVWFVLGDTRPGRKNAEGKTIRAYGTTYFDGSGKPTQYRRLCQHKADEAFERHLRAF